MILNIIVDNFFENLIFVCSFVLQQEFFKGDRGNWLGLCIKFVDELDNVFFYQFCVKLMSFLFK